VASKDTCDSVRNLAVDTLSCGLPASHTDPTGAFPQGRPHEDATHQDVLSGEPLTWWG
jgi:hypothetical protein